MECSCIADDILLAEPQQRGKGGVGEKQGDRGGRATGGALPAAQTGGQPWREVLCWGGGGGGGIVAETATLEEAVMQEKERTGGT